MKKNTEIPMWYTKDEEPIPVWLMKDFHLFNACRLVMFNIHSVKTDMALMFSCLEDQWVDSYDSNFDRELELVRLEKIKRMLVKELKFRLIEIPNIKAVPVFPPELVGCGA